MSANKEYMRGYMKDRYRRRKQAAIKFLGGKCAGCGSDQELEFDHKERKTKYKRIARIWSYSEDRFWEEIKKCQLLCRTCHEEKSIKERGMKRNKGVHGTLGNYNRHGCRCDLCKAAKAESNRKYKKGRG
jgi:5-methylcytosine-specific restriction endonuclease McrA